MNGLYLFAAAAGIPLVAWFLLSGGDDGDDGGGDHDGIGGFVARYLPLTTMAIALAAFGVCGLALGAAGRGAGTTFAAASGVAILAGVLNSTAFAYLRRTDSTTGARDEQLAGAIGRVVLPVSDEHRGRITIAVGGQQVYLSASPLPGSPSGAALEVGAPVLVVEVRAGVASVVRLDAELS